MSKHLSLQTVLLQPFVAWSATPRELTFVLCREGVGTFKTNSAAGQLSPGDVLVTNGREWVEFRAAGGKPLVFGAFHLSWDLLAPLFAANELWLLQRLNEEFEACRLYAAKTRLAIECHRLVAEVPETDTFVHRSQLLHVAALVLATDLKKAQEKRNGSMGIEERLRTIFEELSNEELLTNSGDQLARKFGCSRRHLNRLFHDYFGLSLATLRTELRLLKSLSLLRQPTMKIISVAEQSGFSHLGQFNRMFKKRFGRTPGDWRRANALREAEPVLGLRAEPVCPLTNQNLCPLATSQLAPPPCAGPARHEPAGSLKCLLYAKAFNQGEGCSRKESVLAL